MQTKTQTKTRRVLKNKTTTSAATKRMVRNVLKKAVPKHYVVVDYPRNSEKIKSDCYTFRLGASPCDRVEVCVNNGSWMPCRHSVGYWWFDWYNYKPGNYKMKARVINGHKKFTNSKEKRFKVTKK